MSALGGLDLNSWQNKKNSIIGSVTHVIAINFMWNF